MAFPDKYDGYETSWEEVTFIILVAHQDLSRPCLLVQVGGKWRRHQSNSTKYFPRQNGCLWLLAQKAVKARWCPAPRRRELFHILVLVTSSQEVSHQSYLSGKATVILNNITNASNIKMCKPSQWAFIHVNRSATCKFSSAIIIKPVVFLSLAVWVIYMSREGCYERLCGGFYWTVTSCHE